MLKRIGFLLQVMAIFSLALAPAWARELKSASLVLQWQPQAQFAGFYVAQAKGFYKKAGVDLRIIPGGPDVLASHLLTTGEAQFATMFLATGIQYKAHGMPLVHLAQLVQQSALMLVAHANSGIHEPKDLAGKRIGLWDNEFQLQPQALFLRLGINPHIVPQSDTLNLFLLGGVDAASAMWYNEYHTLLASGLDPEDLQVFFFRDLGLNFPEDGIYTLEKTWSDDPALCKAVAAASLRGWEYAFAHQEEALDLVLNRISEAHLRTNRAHQRFMLERMRDIIQGQENDNIPPLGELSQADYERVAKTLHRQGLINSLPEYSNFTKAGQQ